MNRKTPNKTFAQVTAWAAVVVLSGATLVARAQDQTQNSTPGSPTVQDSQRSDGQIEMDVVRALDASSALKDDLITAATIQSQVSLSGTVSTAASSQLAESIAAHVTGVTKVNNNLKVGNPQAAAEQPADPANQQMADNQQPDDQSLAPPPPSAQAPNDGSMNGQGNQAQPDQGQNQTQQAPPNQNYPPQRPQYAPPPQYGQQSQYPQQPPPPPGYGQQSPYGQQGQYAQQPPPSPAYRQATGPVTLLPSTMLQVRTNESIDSKRAKDGTPVQFTVIRDVAVGGVLAIPRGATVHGEITEVKHSGDLAGSSELALKLTSLDLGGQSYPLDSDLFKVKSPNKANETVGNAIGGGIIGTIIGCAVGRGVGCAVGAGAGIAAGTAASAASPNPRAWIPAEALVTFRLNSPLTVDPVSQQEASRLAQGLYPGGPTLYRRPGPYGYYGPQYAGAYGYGYPYPYGPVYYRPYYTVGGAYYWR